ncbi:MAG: hypothetical protein FJ403_10180 [Verrucomicrobia bacterium]|nr:hypothetical protein [Verrucomicrobiota bacterium]
MIPKFLFRFWCVSISILLADAPLAAEREGSAKITQQDGKLRIEINGQHFTDYNYANVTRPFFYPIYGPSGASMTRNYPMKEVPDEDKDHVHHKGLWYTHGDVNGHDFWAEGKNSGKTVHEKIIDIKSGGKTGSIKTLNKLVALDGTVVCTDERTFRITGDSQGRILDFEITIHASNGPVTFGDTKEGTMAIRVAETMRVKGKVGKGHIVNSEGVRDGETWGKRAKWCDYYGPVEGKTVGVAMFDHPQNPRHPTWWHVRDYGLFAANPFGIHDFEKLADKTKGNWVLPAGQSATFRYRFYFHEGDEKQGKIADRYEDYVRSH